MGLGDRNVPGWACRTSYHLRQLIGRIFWRSHQNDANHMILVMSWQMLVRSMATDGVSTVCTKVHK